MITSVPHAGLNPALYKFEVRVIQKLQNMTRSNSNFGPLVQLFSAGHIVHPVKDGKAVSSVECVL